MLASLPYWCSVHALRLTAFPCLAAWLSHASFSSSCAVLLFSCTFSCSHTPPVSLFSLSAWSILPADLRFWQAQSSLNWSRFVVLSHHGSTHAPKLHGILYCLNCIRGGLDLMVNNVSMKLKEDSTMGPWEIEIAPLIAPLRAVYFPVLITWAHFNVISHLALGQCWVNIVSDDFLDDATLLKNRMFHDPSQLLQLSHRLQMAPYTRVDRGQGLSGLTFKWQFHQHALATSHVSLGHLLKEVFVAHL